MLKLILNNNHGKIPKGMNEKSGERWSLCLLFIAITFTSSQSDGEGLLSLAAYRIFWDTFCWSHNQDYFLQWKFSQVSVCLGTHIFLNHRDYMPCAVNLNLKYICLFQWEDSPVPGSLPPRGVKEEGSETLSVLIH